VYAVKLSELLHMRLVLLHTIKAFPAPDTWSRSVPRSQHQLRTKALLELGRMARIAQEHGAAATHRLDIGIPEDSILNAVEDNEAALLVMGTHGRTGWDRFQLGSSAEAMIRKAPCPVLTVHGTAVADGPMKPRRLKLKRFLVVTDFSAASAAAQAGRYVVERTAASGNPIEVILAEAKRVTADLIVMGTNGRRGMSRLALGSVAESVVRRAGCPVLVVKAGMKPRFDK
jgi:nucleotide-binding universal stress UspA family protein